MPSDEVTGVILAGGRSRRFGEEKAAYVVDGRPMVEHVHRALAAVTGRLLLSARDPNDRFGVSVPVVADRHSDCGPLAGLHAALSAAGTPWVLLVACDMPYLTSSVLGQLVDARAPDDRAVVARTPDGRRQPLCACYHADVLPAATRQLSAGRLSMQELLDRIEPIRFVDVPGEALRNVNTQADLEA